MRKKVGSVIIIFAAMGAMITVANQTPLTGGNCMDSTEQMEENVTEESYVDHMDRSDEGFELVWNDEFDGDSLDLSKWGYQFGTGEQYGLSGWGNEEEEYYTDRLENVKVEDGKLVITAIKEKSSYEGMKYTSGRIRTMADDKEELFSTTYGRVEARMKLPVGEGIWPAFWMLPVDDSIYGGWAASGEIDIMEAMGRLPEKVGGTLHYGKVWPNNTYKTADYVFPEGTDITDYHTYALEWEPGEMRWYVDDECYFTMDKWYSQGGYSATEYPSPAPFDVPFYIVFDLAVGGTFDPEADLSKAEFPAQMLVDFVRVYHKTEGYQVNKEELLGMQESKDEEGYQTYAAEYTDGEFIADKEFSTMNTEAIKDTDGGIKPESKDWQFAVGNFGGAATASVETLDEGIFARIDSTSGGSQTYAVQLIQHFPVLEGYTYQVQFKAKADAKRTFVVSPSGDGDNGWVKYNSYNGTADTTVKDYSFVFKMNSQTDPTARLEFNLGLSKGSIWIGDVSVTLVETEGGVDDDMKKTTLPGGNMIYNGTFDQGFDRLAFWHTQDMDVQIPDYVVKSDGSKDFSRKAEITLTGEAPMLYQTGLKIKPETSYLLKLDITSKEYSRATVSLVGEDGSLYHTETFEHDGNGKKQTFEAKFSNIIAETDDNATLQIELFGATECKLDNVKLKKILTY